MRKMLFIGLMQLLIVSMNQCHSDPDKLVEERVAHFMHEYDIPGIAVALYYKGEQLFYNFGYANSITRTKVTSDTIFPIASITKTFKGIALAYEIEKGAMMLAGPLDLYIPFLKDHPCALSKITLEQLATHTASLPKRLSIGGEHNILEYLLSWKPSYFPGTKFRYSNLGFKILGYALEHVTSLSYDSMIQSIITGPLQMNATFAQVPYSFRSFLAQGHARNGNPVPPQYGDADTSSLKSSSRDMMKYLMANLGVYGPASLQDAMKWAQQGYFQANDQMIQGLGWQRKHEDGILIIEKNGGTNGFSSWIGFDPVSQTGIVLLSNRSQRLKDMALDLLLDLINDRV